jgi:hypothetical protein
MAASHVEDMRDTAAETGALVAELLELPNLTDRDLTKREAMLALLLWRKTEAAKRFLALSATPSSEKAHQVCACCARWHVATSRMFVASVRCAKALLQRRSSNTVNQITVSLAAIVHLRGVITLMVGGMS